MRFEVQHALRDLDERTPVYFLQEIFAHGDLKGKISAMKVLTEINTHRKSVRILREILKIA
jgi:hypothetical protein